jgi:hypothetical protein
VDDVIPSAFMAKADIKVDAPGTAFRPLLQLLDRNATHSGCFGLIAECEAVQLPRKAEEMEQENIVSSW